jgi:hypothetical protein
VLANSRTLLGFDECVRLSPSNFRLAVIRSWATRQTSKRNELYRDDNLTVPDSFDDVLFNASMLRVIKFLSTSASVSGNALKHLPPVFQTPFPQLWT